VAIDDPGARVDQVGKLLNVIQLTGFDQRGDDAPGLGATVGAAEQHVFPIGRDRTERAVDGVVVELDSAIMDNVRQTFPV